MKQYKSKFSEAANLSKLDKFISEKEKEYNLSIKDAKSRLGGDPDEQDNIDYFTAYKVGLTDADKILNKLYKDSVIGGAISNTIMGKQAAMRDILEKFFK